MINNAIAMSTELGENAPIIRITGASIIVMTDKTISQRVVFSIFITRHISAHCPWPYQRDTFPRSSSSLPQ